MSDIQFTPEFIQYQRDMLQEEFGDPVFPLPDVPVFQIATKLYPAALDTIDALRAEVERSRAVQPFTLIDDGLPEMDAWNGTRSNNVLLAYKVAGAQYHGSLMVTYYAPAHGDHPAGWQYEDGKTLEEWGYEAVAWRPLDDLKAAAIAALEKQS